MTPQSSSAFSNASAYDGYVGRWSRLVGQSFIAWLNPPPGRTWLDMGAGTGILTEIVIEHAAPQKIVGVDLSPEYIEVARQRVRDARAEFVVADAQSPIADAGSYDIAISGLVLNFVPDPQQAVNRMAEAVRPGGQVAAYVWDYGGRMEMMRHFWDAATVVDPSAAEQDSGPRFAIARPENLRVAFEAARLGSVETTPIDAPTHFASFDDYWLPFLGAQGSVSKYLRSLDNARREAIREQLTRQLPIASDGTIDLIARAWAVKGAKPQTG